MKGKYSQNDEDILIEKYFGDRAETCLSIGENDARTLSNVLACIERGWTAVLIEPSKTAFNKLINLHIGNLKCFNYNLAIGEIDGEADFYESGEHLGNGDTSLISTLIPDEIKRWKGTKFDNFTQTKTQVVKWETFYAECPIKKYNLISVDIEGEDLFVVQKMNLTEMGCEMLIVEWNGKQFAEFNEVAEKHGMKLYAKNGENLIFVK